MGPGGESCGKGQELGEEAVAPRGLREEGAGGKSWGQAWPGGSWRSPGRGEQLREETRVGGREETRAGVGKLR